MAAASPRRLASAGLALLVVGGAVAGALLWLSYNRDRQAPAEVPVPASAFPLAPPGVGPDETADLVRTNRESDDASRGVLFRRLLEENGQRCDAVRSQVMRDPGKWIVTCPPGEVFSLEFDARGALVSAAELQSAAP